MLAKRIEQSADLRTLIQDRLTNAGWSRNVQDPTKLLHGVGNLIGAEPDDGQVHRCAQGKVVILRPRGVFPQTRQRCDRVLEARLRGCKIGASQSRAPGYVGPGEI